MSDIEGYNFNENVTDHEADADEILDLLIDSIERGEQAAQYDEIIRAGNARLKKAIAEANDTTNRGI